MAPSLDDMPTEILQRICTRSNINTLTRVSHTCRHLYLSLIPLINALEIRRLQRLASQEKLAVFDNWPSFLIHINSDHVNPMYTDKVSRIHLSLTYGDHQNAPDYRTLAGLITSNPNLITVMVNLLPSLHK